MGVCQDREKCTLSVPKRGWFKPTFSVCGKNVLTYSCATNRVGLADQPKYYWRGADSTRVSH